MKHKNKICFFVYNSMLKKNIKCEYKKKIKINRFSIHF